MTAATLDRLFDVGAPTPTERAARRAANLDAQLELVDTAELPVPSCHACGGRHAGRCSAEALALELAAVVVIVPCSALKADVPVPTSAPAGDVYLGSFHRFARRHAERLGARVLIHSALHGLLELDKRITGYNVRIGDANAFGALPGLVRNQAKGLGLLTDDVRVVSFCPNAYTAVLAEAIPNLITPLAGSRGIGDQRGRIAALELDELLR